MTRPALSRKMNPSEFVRWYWLKAELQAFCRELGIAGSGSKQDLQRRIAIALSGGDAKPIRITRPNATIMPVEFTPETVIGVGWKCSQALRAYFTTVHGRGFRFNAALREFIAQGHGKTLAEASDCYVSSRDTPAEQIAQQFEYNRHMREFHAAHPGATHQQAVEAWWVKRSRADA